MKKYILFLLPLFLGLLVSNDIEAKKKKYPNGDRYEGEWKEGTPNGNGKMTYTNGDIYKGNWLAGYKHGEGEMIYANGDIYTGDWLLDNKRYGEMTYTNGNRYEGSWAGDDPNGNGKMTYTNGDIYVGNWKMGVRDNIGIITYPSGDSFECNYSNGVLVSGILSRTNGDQYRAKWFDQKSGNGTINYENGDVYVGDFKDLLPDGEGKLMDKNGLEKNGKWEKGVLRNGQEECKGKLGIYKWNINKGEAINANFITLEKGTIYKGEIENELPMGNGIFSSPECSLDGVWKNGKLALLKKGVIKTNFISHSVTLENENLHILINYSDNSIENKQYSNCKIDQLPTLVNDVILYISKKDIEKKHVQEEKKLEEYASKNLKTYRGENFKVRERMWLDIGDVEYQYYMKNDIETKHGSICYWNMERYNSICSMKGTYKHGKKNGTWIIEEKVPEYKDVPTGRYEYNWAGNLREITKAVKTGRHEITLLTMSYSNDRLNGICTKETFNPNGSLKLKIEAYYKDNIWDKRNYVFIDKSKNIKYLVSYNKNGNLHGNIFLKNDDVELTEIYDDGKLIKSIKKNIKKGVVLTPLPEQNSFNEMFKLILPIGGENVISELFGYLTIDPKLHK